MVVGKIDQKMIGHQHLVNHRANKSKGQSDVNGPEDVYKDDNGMRIGVNYQAQIPQLIAFAPAPPFYEEEKAIMVWSPYNEIPEQVLVEYINKAKERYLYTPEQALGMLSWHSFDLNKAYADLPNFVPYPNEWSVEEKVLFEQAYQFHQKQFLKIRSMLPDKTMANLINYYYTWKKTRTRASLMERQTRRFAARKAADSNAASDEDMGEEEVECEDEGEKEITNIDINLPAATSDPNVQDGTAAPGYIPPATNYLDDEGSPALEEDVTCGVCQKDLYKDKKFVDVVIDSQLETFCPKHFDSWIHTGRNYCYDVETGDCYYHPIGGKKSMLFTYKDVQNLVNNSPKSGDAMLKFLDSQIEDLKRSIQGAKQTISQVVEKIGPLDQQIKQLDPKEFDDFMPKLNYTKTWNTEETTLVIQGLKRFGEDFDAISDIVRTKTSDSIRQFYVSQKDRLGLEALVDDHEKTVAI